MCSPEYILRVSVDASVLSNITSLKGLHRKTDEYNVYGGAIDAAAAAPIIALIFTFFPVLPSAWNIFLGITLKFPKLLTHYLNNHGELCGASR